MTRKIILLLITCAAFLQAAEVFHFNFKNAGDQHSILSAEGGYQCIAADSRMKVEHGALRIAPAANIYITGAFPSLQKELTISLWLLRRNTSWDTPLLMRGYHSGKIDFLMNCRWVFPAFSYKDPRNLGVWDGLYVLGPIPRDMSYGKAAWRKTNAHIRSERWCNMQVTFKNGETRIYLNGKLNCQNISACKTLTESSDRIYIGSERLSPKARLGYLTGDFLINDLRLFNQALSASELQKIYLKEKPSYPETEINLEKCNAYPPAPGYDPDFTVKLPLTSRFEKQILPNFDTRILPGQADSKITFHRGAHVLNIGGELYFPLQLSPAAGRGLKKLFYNVRDFAAADVNLVNLKLPLEESWIGDNQYDFKKVDEIAASILRANPQARMMCWMLLRPPSWFKARYPDEIERSYLGEKLNWNIGGGPLGSDIWERMVNDYLKAAIRHIEKSFYAHRVYGYLPAGGESGEWYWPGGVYRQTVGYSPATAKSFRNYLKEIYGTDKALQKAWNQPSVTLNTAAVPNRKKREKYHDENFFLDRHIDQDIVDFRRYMSARTLASIQRAAATIKNNSGRKKLVFVYNGYSLSPTSWKLYNSGLFITENVQQCKDIDVIVTPITYSERNGGKFGGCVNPWAAATALAQKLSWQEDDLRTHFCLSNSDGKCETAEETSEVFKRDLGYTLTRNIGNWWLLFEPFWCHDILTMNTIAKIQKIASAELHTPRQNLAETAFIWDEESLYELNRIRSNFIDAHAWNPYRDSYQMGAPADFYLSGNLDNPKMPDYKLYIMMNFYRINKTLMQKIENKVKKNNTVVVWCYAPGYVMGNGKNTTEHMKKITGMDIKILPGKHNGYLKITDRNHAITRQAGTSANFSLAPAFTVSDHSAKILGTFNGHPALAVKEFSDWRSVYTLMPLNKELLQGLCDYAGVHIYSRDFDILTVNSNFLALHASANGKTKITLPERQKVTELFSGKTIGNNVKIFHWRQKKGQTALFKLEDAK